MPLIVAVTGACGLIGSAVCKLALEEGHTVLGLDLVHSTLVHPNFKAKIVNTSQYGPFKDAIQGCDSLVHLAALLPVNPGVGGVENPQEVIHSENVVSSYNALKIAAELGIKRVVQASSVNVIGLAFSRRPTLDYIPLDEKHPFYPEDAYSLSKCICEQQASAIARRYSDIRIASLRFHWVIPSRGHGAALFDAAGVSSKFIVEHTRDLWGWVSVKAAARACLLGLTATEGAWNGHEPFFIVAPNTLVETDSEELCRKFYPEVKDIRRPWNGNSSFFDCSKAETVLGWREGDN